MADENGGSSSRLMFDSHLDLAWNALSWKRDLLLPLAEMNAADRRLTDHPSRGRATVTLPELRRARVAVCLATVMGRVPYGDPTTVHGTSLDFPAHENVYGFAQGQLAYYRLLARRGHVRLIRDACELRQHWDGWNRSEKVATASPLGIILAMEGCDAICEPDDAQGWFDDGLRCAGLVHYGSSKYASGTGDEGPVTPDGLRLLDEFDRLGIVLDTTHLCDTSFEQALDHFAGAVLASHQNCRALVAGQRQFSDPQIQRLIERGGVLGVAFDAWMMYPAGWQRGETSREVVQLEAAVDHVDHVCQLAGSDRHIAIGSDLDGGFGTEQCPTGLDSFADLQRLGEAMSNRGYDDASIERFFGLNWLEFFATHLPNSNGERS